jgi:hypothetical protein
MLCFAYNKAADFDSFLRNLKEVAVVDLLLTQKMFMIFQASTKNLNVLLMQVRLLIQRSKCIIFESS